MAKPTNGMLVVMVLVGLIFVSFLAVNIATSQNTLNPRQKMVAEKQEEATLIQEGVFTEKQKAHRKLFKHHGPKLRDLAVGREGTVEVEEETGFVINDPSVAPDTSPLRTATGNADAVVVGVLKSKSAQLTEGENFIFTDYEMTVEEVIKNNVLAPIQAGNTIIVTRDGGSVKIKGKVFTAKRADFKPTLIGNRYLFFLRFIPETGSYLAYGNGAFELRGDKVFALEERPAAGLLRADAKDASPFLNEVRAFVAH